MRVLIIGCGYVGLRLGAELARQGHQVWGLRRTPGPASDGILPLQGDITDPASLKRLPADFDWVVNCVSSAGGTPEDYRDVYLEGMRNVIDWLAAAPPRAFVYTSSTSVYGQNHGSLVDESSPTEPVPETARILLQTERLLLGAVQDRAFPAIILRLAGIYGPGRGYWFKQFLAGEARMEGRGERILNMVHRDDVVGAVEAALERGKPGTVYNVVDDEPASQFTFFQWLADQLGRPMPPSVQTLPELARKRGAGHKRVANTRLREELRYTLKFPTFREGFLAELRTLNSGKPEAYPTR